MARLRGGRLSPERLAGSIALGLFIGIQPLYGFHLPLCVLIGGALGLDVIVTYAAANISIPPMIPVLLYGSVQIGSVLLTGQPREHTLDDIRAHSWLATGEQLVVGSVVLGALAGLGGGGLAYALARVFGWGEVDRAFREATRRTAARYASAPPAHHHYVRSKLRWDPLARELEDHAGQGRLQGDLIDLGAGRGQFSLLAVELGSIRSIFGFDHDAQKIEIARSAAASLDIPQRFEPGDLRTTDLPEADVAFLLDVLHYLPADDQRRVVERAARALRPGGYLFLRETNRGSGFGARLAAGLERIGRALGVNRGERLEFLPPGAFAEQLQSAGFTLEMAAGRGALDNVLLVARKGEAPSSSDANSTARAESSE